jgi:hypothetical protein
VKGKILCPAGCQNSFSRITEAKEILKNPRPAGSWRPLKCISSGKEKDRPQRAESPALSVLCTEKPDSGSLRLTKSKFLPRCQNPQFCGFAPRGKLVGECLPQTLLWRLAPQKYFRPAGRFFAGTVPEIPNRPAYFL